MKKRKVEMALTRDELVRLSQALELMRSTLRCTIGAQDSDGISRVAREMGKTTMLKSRVQQSIRYLDDPLLRQE